MKISFGESGKSFAFADFIFSDNSSVEIMPDGRKKITVGLGAKKSFNKRKFIIAARRIISLAKSNKIKKISLPFPRFRELGISDHDIAELLGVNFVMADYEFVKYKTKPKDGWKFIDEIKISGRVSDNVKAGFKKGHVIGTEVNNCRTLANCPAGEMTPDLLSREARKAVRGTKVSVSVLGVGDMKKLKMGGILGVSQGSDAEPRFIVMQYRGHNSGAAPMVLVGKGVTFDTGGLNLKPGETIYEMHMDMSGGAAVIHALVLAAKLKIKKNVVGIIPAVENMPSGSSYRPGDILRSMSGKTIEVVNTDAEGRIIVADGLTYAERYKPRLVVDVATLTGAAQVALGQRASAIFTKDDKLRELFMELGEASGDYVWPLPLWEEYEDEIKGTFGDVANVGKIRYGGAISGAMFLYQFAKGFPWVHIDIAPRMTAIEGEYLAKGAAGAPVRLLIKLIERF